MTREKSRRKNSDKVRGVAKISDIVYNEQAGGNKVVGPILGQLTHLGVLDGTGAAFPQGKGAIIAFYNASGVTAFIRTDTAGGGAVPTIADGIALKPDDYTMLTFENDQRFIRSSAADIVMYRIEDDSEIR